MDCIGFVCFEPLATNGTKIFGFAEYLAALALMLVAWTLGERQYKFRLQTAGWNVRRNTFICVIAVGLLCLLTDVWRASAWPVIRGPLITPVVWQAGLAAAFLLAFMVWVRTAFLRPPRFNRRTARSFNQVAFDAITTGDNVEIAHLAGALGDSAEAIVKMASAESDPHALKADQDAALAWEMLHLLADPAFCRIAVKGAPRTLFLLFAALRDNKGAAASMRTFSTNILAAAVTESDSFLHRETADWQAGLAAQSQHVTRCLYGDVELLDMTPMVMMPRGAHEWTSDQWAAYLRAARHAFASYARRGQPVSSYTVANIFATLENGTRNLHRINGTSDPNQILIMVTITEQIIEFIHDAAAMLDEGPASVTDWANLNNYQNPIQRMAKILAEILFDAAHVTHPSDTSWSVQYGVAWSGVFDRYGMKNGASLHEVRERVARMVWGEIRELEYSPGYVGSRLMGLCLNIGWVSTPRGRRAKSEPTAERALLSMSNKWAIRHFDWLHRLHPEMAVVGFSELVTYRKRTRTLRKKWEATAWRPQPEYTDLVVDRAPQGDPEDQLKPLDQFPREFVSRKRTVPTNIR